MAQATERQLRFIDAESLRGWTTTLEDVPVMSLKDEVLAGLDGLLVGEDDRPLYLAVATRGEPRRRYLLPIGTTWFDETTGVVRTDADSQTLATYPEFDPRRYQQMSSEESWTYEKKVLAACCPETLAQGGSRLEHYNRRSFRDPGWLKRPNTTNKDTSRPTR